MTERVALVTGATDGIGRQTALELARAGMRVIVHGRSHVKVDQVRQALERALPSARLDTAVADFASLAQVRAMATELSRRLPALHVLVNNAGVYVEERRLSADGYELTFAVNHLAPFLLTRELLPLLQRSAPARIVNVSSTAHQRGRLDFGDLQAERGYSAYGAYATSKLANVLFTRELADRLAGSGVTANSLHPGVIGTKLLRRGFGIDGGSVEEGARTSVHLALSPEVDGVTGRYFSDCREAPIAPQAQDAGAQRRLWEESERLVAAR